MRTFANGFPKPFWPLLSALVVATAALMMFASVGWAKDRDGSRMRGKSVAVGTKVSDKLDGAEDQADWRYVELKRAGKLTVVVTLTPAAATASVRITDAQGNVLSESTTGGAKRSLTIDAQPGIYYLEVASGGGLSYTLIATAS